MKLNGLQIKYQGFRPSEFEESQLRLIFERLYDEAPYGSNLKVTFTKTREGIKGILHITSSAGPFFAVAHDTGIHELSGRLVNQIRRKLDRWKAKRFKRHPHVTETYRISS